MAYLDLDPQGRVTFITLLVVILDIFEPHDKKTCLSVCISNHFRQKTAYSASETSKNHISFEIYEPRS